MTMPGQVSITIDASNLQKYLSDLDRKMNTAESRAILRKASTRVMIPALRRNMTVSSSNLKKSFGNVTGRSKNPAVVFAGPRMDQDHNVRRSTPMGRITVTVAAKYKGHLANIIENNTFRPRYPRDQRREQSKPRIPGFTEGKGAPHNIFEHTGIFPARPFIGRTYDTKANAYLKEVMTQGVKLIKSV